MCDSAVQVFGFDGLKDWYVKHYVPKLKKTPCSNDALWLDDNHIVFIEFKNGKIGPVENNEIVFKLYDSLLLILDDKFDLSYCHPDFKQNISYTREHMDYIYWSIMQINMMKTTIRLRRKKVWSDKVFDFQNLKRDRSGRTRKTRNHERRSIRHSEHWGKGASSFSVWIASRAICFVRCIR